MSCLTKWHLGVRFRGMAWIVCMITSGTLAHASSSDVVLYASKAPVKSGTWAVVADSTAAGGYAIGNQIWVPLVTSVANQRLFEYFSGVQWTRLSPLIAPNL